MLWHEQSWPKLKKTSKDTPVIVPLASCEQHGHHLPVFVDTIQVTKIAERVEQDMPKQVLLLPTLWLGCSHHHIDFPGTVSVLPSLYGQMIRSVALSILNAGFRRIFFLNGHGGNEVPASAALTELVAENDQADGAMLVLSSWWGIGRQAMAPEKVGLTTPWISHACEVETSMMLFLRPDLVEMKKVIPTKPVMDNQWYCTEYGRKVMTYHRYRRQTAPGNLGAPHKAKAETGRRIFENIVAEIEAFLKDYRKWPMMKVIGPR